MPFSLEKKHLRIVNKITEKTLEEEGGSLSEIALPSEKSYYLLLLLDGSQGRSAKAEGAKASIFKAARSLIRTLVESKEPRRRHHVAIYAYGAEMEGQWFSDFSQDPKHLYGALDRAEAFQGKGQGNPFVSYLEALRKLKALLKRPDPSKEAAIFFFAQETPESAWTSLVQSLLAPLLSEVKALGLRLHFFGLSALSEPSRLASLGGGGESVHLASPAALPQVVATETQKESFRSGHLYALGVCTAGAWKSNLWDIHIEHGKLQGVLRWQFSSAGLSGKVEGCIPAHAAYLAPPSPKLCLPCLFHAECAPEGVCMNLKGKGFCGQDCTSSPCPSGYTCFAILGTGQKQCAPPDQRCPE